MNVVLGKICIFMQKACILASESFGIKLIGIIASNNSGGNRTAEKNSNLRKSFERNPHISRKNNFNNQKAVLYLKIVNRGKYIPEQTGITFGGRS